jgi:endonuclease/exonuclease/phosphatase (EEP) superfamily protein YafD
VISVAEVRGVLTGLALVAVALLVAVSGPILVPGQELLSSLRFHIGAALLALPLALFVMGAWWRGLLMLLLVGASLGQGGWIVWQQQALRIALADRPTLANVDVLSINALASNPRGREIVDYILTTAPDVVVIMESTAITPYLDLLAVDYPYRAGCDANGRNCDVLIFSRTPIEDSRALPLGPYGSLRLVTAQTTVAGQPVVILGAHLSKPYFDEMAWFDLDRVRRTIARQGGPVIVAGDFNAAAWSDAVADFATAGNLAPPPSYPATWPVRAGQFGVPIDNMFTHGNAVIETIEALDDSMGSNHRGLRASVRLLGD